MCVLGGVLFVWVFYLFACLLFSTLLKQSGFEGKALYEPDPAAHSPFSKVILICTTNPNRNNCPKCSDADQSRLFSEK